MDNSYNELKSITDKYYTDGQMPPYYIFIELLKKYNINIRNKDGFLVECTFSIPKSKNNSIALGIRYQKIDGTPTEDLFLFQKNKQIKKYYNGRQELELPEYLGTHKGPFTTR